MSTPDWWKTNEGFVRGMEIWEDHKSGGGRYREVPDKALRCQRCLKTKGVRARKIIRCFIGPGGRIWLWVPEERDVLNHPDASPTEPKAEWVPPSAVEYVDGAAGLAECRDCRHSQFFRVRPDGQIDVSSPPGSQTRGMISEE